MLPRLGAHSGSAAGDNLLLDLAIPSEKSHQQVNKGRDSLKTAQGPGAGRPSGTAAVGTHPRKTHNTGEPSRRVARPHILSRI